jgi:hypothetical protein
MSNPGLLEFAEDFRSFMVPTERFLHLWPGRSFVPQDHYPLTAVIKKQTGYRTAFFQQLLFVVHGDNIGLQLYREMLAQKLA